MSVSRLTNLAWIACCCTVSSCSLTEPTTTTRESRPSNAGAAGTPLAANGGVLPGGQSTSSNRPDLVVPTMAGSGTVCASAVVQTAKTMPTIMFVIDGSGSMCEQFGSEGTRWQSLRTALLDPTKGLVYRLQNSVSFGATLYDGTIDTALSLSTVDSLIQNPLCALLASVTKGAGDCPQLIEAAPKLNNAMAIDLLYPPIELGGSTPTDKAMSHVMDVLIPAIKPIGPDGKAQGQMYVILATDGAPNDICLNGTGGDGSAERQGVIAAVDRGAAAGITTWVISLASGDPTLQAHLDDVAKHGAPKTPDAHTFSPTSPDALIMTLAQLLGGAVGCHIELSGTVKTGQECVGKVEENGQALPCCQSTGTDAWTCSGASTPTPNGWRLSDPHSIELIGDACANFLLGSDDLLSATFPCEVFSPD